MVCHDESPCAPEKGTSCCWLECYASQVKLVASVVKFSVSSLIFSASLTAVQTVTAASDGRWDLPVSSAVLPGLLYAAQSSVTQVHLCQTKLSGAEPVGCIHIQRAIYLMEHTPVVHRLQGSHI